MIKTKDITFKYKNDKTYLFPNISLKNKECLLILGNSGIGKTTLIHIIAGLIKPIKGSTIINNTDINTLSASKLDKFRGEHIGIVFQKNVALKSLSIYDNLKARIFFTKKSNDNSNIDNILKELNLLDEKNKKPNELSEGQQQRLNIALALIHNPKLILADEPTSSLDDENCKKVIELLKNQVEKTNANLIIITHDNRVKQFFKNKIQL